MEVMCMFKKMLASLGIGSAEVNLEIPKPQAELGGVLEGTVEIKGGNIEQEVEKIYINVVLTSAYKSGDETKTVSRVISSVTVGEKMNIKPGQKERIPVSFQIPYNIPISKGRTRYYLRTGLDIKQALDPADHDEITILPNKYLQMLFDAVAKLGFMEKRKSGDYNGRFQEFEYKPSNFMVRELDEMEIYPVAGERELSVVMQIDKKNRGLFGGLLDDLDLDERYIRFSLPYTQMDSVAQVSDLLKDEIEREYRKI